MPNLSWEKFWATHNKMLVFASIFVFIVSGVFLVFAFNYNSQANSLTSNNKVQAILNASNQTQSNIPQSESGMTQFTLPGVFGNAGVPDIISVNCSVYSNALVQGNPVTITVNITRDNPIPEVMVIGAGFDIQPANAISVETSNPWALYNGGYYEIPDPVRLSYFPAFGGYNSSSVWVTEEWYGSDNVIFQNAGSITLQISAGLLPTQDVWNYVNWTTFPSDFSVNVTIPNINIQSLAIVEQQQLAQQSLSQQQTETALLNQMQIQQQISDYRNSSLTYFVLFFASIDIAVVIFDHSNDDDKKTEYEEKRAKQQYLKNKEKIEYAT